MTLELVNELGDIQVRVVKDRQPIERVQPLKTADAAPLVAIANVGGYWSTADRPAFAQGNVLTLPKLVKQRPVVVGFYCPCWGRYADPFLTTLIDLAHQVDRAGGQLLVFANEHPRYLPQKALQAPMTLVYDADKIVAQQFGVYAETDPIWDRISGISEDVYIPALYVIDGNQQIRYHFLDENFEGFTDHTTLCNALVQ
ncbi:redoxin domain-containing protein [uncultured Spirosoma sp.]|uniref:redoxin domain-containing protein n=1 Tax=uncultured Spirosoma sp. TaxID=278208 RepID=UPI00258501E8|nr:redoxin domain-containing protein [uncultured Spirosoma sp.]